MPKLKAAIMQKSLESYEAATRFHSQISKLVPDPKSRARWRLPGGGMRTRAEIESDITNFAAIHGAAKHSQTIIFSAEQADIFCDILAKGDVLGLEYRLPFQDVVLEFTRPVTMTAFDPDSGVLGLRTVSGLLLTQIVCTKETYEENVAKIKYADSVFGFQESEVLSVNWGKSSEVTINHVGIVDQTFDVEKVIWTSQVEYFDIYATDLEERIDWRKKFKALAIACIGYINCENVYLHREGDVPEAVNAKRERKGKSRLEPYYICRIRGVQYDGAGATGHGSSPGIRFDVRGHFRKLASGKTTWVRPHQRGLANELYVPKTYLVEKGNLP